MLGGLKRILLKKEENGWFCFGVRLECDVIVKFFGDRGVFIVGGFSFWFFLFNFILFSIKNNFIFGVVI